MSKVSTSIIQRSSQLADDVACHIHGQVSSVLYQFCSSLTPPLPMLASYSEFKIVRQEFLICQRTALSVERLIFSLHFLPIVSRIKFELATFTFKALASQQPDYLYDLIYLRQSWHVLSSSSDHLSLNEPCTRTAFADCAFSVAVPKIWNNIPVSIRKSPSCRRCLQTLI